jgi:hypothetical protein
VALLGPGAELAKRCLVNALLGANKALEIMRVAHEKIMSLGT